MNKSCARCDKTVYPTEELKCLDKVWHKGCFKCQECGMTLNMRTYKGYGKLPYCESHVPKAKHTTMAETPELKRIAENTKLQSNVKYHADFEKSKGKFTQVADDPETLRIKANTRIISNVAYHGELEKKAHMERQRLINENGELLEIPSPDNYHQQIESYATEMLPPTPQMPPPPAQPQKNHYQPPQPQQTPNRNQPQDYYSRPKYDNAEYTYNSNQYPVQAQPPNHYPTPPQQYTNPPVQYANPPYQSQKYDDYYAYGQYQHQSVAIGQQQKIGRIQDYDPLTDGPRAPPNAQRASSTTIYNSASETSHKGAHKPAQSQQSRSIGRVTDMDPLAEETPQRAATNTSAGNQQRVYIAMYDYEANDSDEVSFREGDLISNVSAIDSGWMTGQVLRTGRAGMLPANYVELAPAHYAN